MEIMQIHGVSHLHGAQSIQGPHRVRAAESAPPMDAWWGVDEVEISSEADLVSRVHDMPDIRADRVAQIRAEIAAGIYESGDKLDVAVGRLLDEMSY
jgi:negative regulator of flagellin synthesis FlgM